MKDNLNWEDACGIIKHKYNELSALDKKSICQTLMNVFGKPKKRDFVRHHWSYRFENIFDTILLRSIDHLALHHYLHYDYDLDCYKIPYSKIILDTKKEHIKYLVKIRKKLNKRIVHVYSATELY